LRDVRRLRVVQMRHAAYLDGQSTLKTAIQIVHDDAASGSAAACCPSCQAPAVDKFCSRCGESIAVHAPSAGEFLHEFVGHYVALEGKLWQTLRLLMFRPGQLTVDHNRGRRVPYINPLRLYLTLSLVVFALIKSVGIDLPHVTLEDEAAGLAYLHKIDDPTRLNKTPYAKLYIQVEIEEERAAMRKLVALTGRFNADWAENGARFMDQPDSAKAQVLNNGFFTYLPYMLIGALPLFALYLKLMFRRSGRRYGEHLVFALNVTAFAFLLMSAMILIPGNLVWLFGAGYYGAFAQISIWDWMQLLPLIWMVAYLPAALRRVYGGKTWKVWIQSIVLMSVHVSVILSLVAAAEIIAIFKHG